MNGVSAPLLVILILCPGYCRGRKCDRSEEKECGRSYLNVSYQLYGEFRLVRLRHRRVR